MKSNRIKIFVEGIADKKFIYDYIEYLDIPSFEYIDIIDCNGWTSIKEEHILNQLVKNTDENGINLVIFDADKDFEKRKQELLYIKNKNNVDFNLFLLPNNSDDGTLETLLMNIINPNNEAILDCWQRYEQCLKSKSLIIGKELTLPAIKTKVYAYLEALLDDTKKGKEGIKESKRDYKNTNLWKLDSQYILPLKEFLLSNTTLPPTNL